MQLATVLLALMLAGGALADEGQPAAPSTGNAPTATAAAPAAPTAQAAPSAQPATAGEAAAPAGNGTTAPETKQMSHAEAERQGLDEDGYRVSLSMPTEDDRTAWTRPGLRVELAIERGLLRGPAPAAPFSLTTFRVRPRIRLDQSWSVAANLGYGVASGSFSGLRWSALFEPTYHPTPSLGLSLGIGYGGFVVTRTTAPQSSSEIASRTLSNSELMYSCNGSGLVSQARLEYLFVVGPLFSTGPYLVADSQWTGCTESFNKVDRETGQAAVGTQWWLSLGGAIGWWFSWR